MKNKSKVSLLILKAVIILFFIPIVPHQVQAQEKHNKAVDDQVIVYPLPSKFKVVDAGLSTLLSWTAPQQTTSQPASLLTEPRNQNILTKENQPIFDLHVLDQGDIGFYKKESKSLEYPHLLYDNGPFINSPGTGPNGTDQSVLQNTSLGMSTHGAGVQYYEGSRVSDEFVVTEDWVVESFTFFTYQTGSGSVSTITEAYVQVWDGNPSTNGQIIWGNLNYNRISSTIWTNTYRISETNATTNRPVMSVTCATPGLALPPGTYWVDFSLDGTLSSGPWALPITINGQGTTGNALHFSNIYGWQNFVDTEINTQQGVPFVVQGIKGSGAIVSGTLIGYKILRDGTEIATVDPTTLNFIDEGLTAGSYTYSLIALYGDPYPGESSPLSASIEVFSPSLFPFYENWKTGLFETNHWSFIPYQTNWSISPDYGKPAPTAQFRWTPGLLNYSISLVSNFIDATSAEQNATFQFDVALNNFTSTGNEKLKISIWNGSSWVLLETISNNFSFNWDTRIYDVTPHVLGKITRLKFEAKGFSSPDIINWIIDNIKLYEGLSSFQPEIGLSPPALEFWQPSGGSQTQELTISNTGQDPLFWNAAIQYLDSQKNAQALPQSVEIIASPIDPHLAPADAIQKANGNSVVLNYDNGYVNSIGLDGGGYFIAAVRFSSEITAPYAGYTMESVDVYIKDLPLNSKLYIWGKGSSSVPGRVLYEQSFTAVANSWNTISLNNPIALSGQDVWIGYAVTHVSSKKPAGSDDGPGNPDGGWFSNNGTSWSRIADLDMNYNWNIRALVKGSDYSWLSINNTSGITPPGNSQSLMATVQTTDLGAGSYYANIVIPSNDPDDPMKIVPVGLHVGVGLNEKKPPVFVAYPVPATHELTVELIQQSGVLQLINSLGQLVFKKDVKNGETYRFDIRHLKPGPYSLQLLNSNGSSYLKTIIISR